MKRVYGILGLLVLSTLLAGCTKEQKCTGAYLDEGIGFGVTYTIKHDGQKIKSVVTKYEYTSLDVANNVCEQYKQMDSKVTYECNEKNIIVKYTEKDIEDGTNYDDFIKEITSYEDVPTKCK